MDNDDDDETSDDDDQNLKLHVCDECGKCYLTERQLRAHQSAHSNYFENEEYK